MAFPCPGRQDNRFGKVRSDVTMTVNHITDHDMTQHRHMTGEGDIRGGLSHEQPPTNGRRAVQTTPRSHRTEIDRSVTAGMKLRSLIPVLDVRDVETSIEFYCGALGFVLRDKVEWGGRTEWALLQSEHVQLMLCVGQEAEIEDVVRSEEGVFFLYHDDPEALLIGLSTRGYDGVSDVLNPDGGRRDFFLRDPDGYVLWFSHKPMGTRPD